MRLVNKAGGAYMVCQREAIELSKSQVTARVRARVARPTRSFTQQINFIPPGKAGVHYHHQNCKQKAPGCAQASIEYAYAMRMKPASCCFQPDATRPRVEGGC